MKLTTSKGKEYNVQWVDGPTITNGMVMIQLADDRRLPEIAAEFDGVERVERVSETQGNKTWEGFTRLQRISVVGEGRVLVALGKE